MGQPRQSQSNDEKNTDKKGAKQPSEQSQQSAAQDQNSSRTTGTKPQQNQESARSPNEQKGNSDGTSPRAGTRRDADTSESAHQENRRGLSRKGEH